MAPAAHADTVVVIDGDAACDRGAMQMPDVSEADRSYLERVVEDGTELLGSGIEVRRLDVDINGDVVLRLTYRLGSAGQTSEGRGETVVAAHAALRHQLVVDRIGLGVRALYLQHR